ncbi:hypothetical protein Tco_1277884 [Tanacetum coccineum]
MGSITSIKCVLTQEHLDAIRAKYFVPEEVHPQLPSSNATMHERPTGKVGMYTRFFDYANYRIPFSNFFVSVLTHFRIPYKNGWFGFTKRPNVRACYSKNFDSVKNWNDHFFWVDEFVVPASARFGWFSGTNIVKDRAPAISEYNVEHANTLIAQAFPFLRFPEKFLCWVGISRNYLFNKDDLSMRTKRVEMDLNAFIRTADPRKVRIVERARTGNERPIVIVAKHRTVTLLSTSNPRLSGELLDSVEREFGEDVSGSGGKGQENASVGSHGNVEPILPVADDVVAETGSSRVKHSKKKMVIGESEDTPAASHPPKKLRDDYGKTSGFATGGKSPGVINSFTFGGRRDHTDSTNGPALRTIGPSERFVVLSDSSHHSSAKSADIEVDSLIRSVALVMTVATTVTTSVSAAATMTVTPAVVGKDKNVPTPSVFAGSLSFLLVLVLLRRPDTPRLAFLQEVRGFELNDGRSCADMIDHFTPPTFFKAVHGIEHEKLFKEFNVSASHNLSLSSEVKMRAEYNILEKRKWKSLAEERNNLLQVKNKEIESSLLEQEHNALEIKAISLESTVAEKDRELADLETSSFSLRVQNQSLVNQVHELEVSSVGLREKLETYEGSMKQLEEFQDNLMKPLEARLAEIDANFIRCCMHFQDNFHLHLLKAITGRR